MARLQRRPPRPVGAEAAALEPQLRRADLLHRLEGRAQGGERRAVAGSHPGEGSVGGYRAREARAVLHVQLRPDRARVDPRPVRRPAAARPRAPGARRRRRRVRPRVQAADDLVRRADEGERRPADAADDDAPVHGREDGGARAPRRRAPRGLAPLGGEGAAVQRRRDLPAAGVPAVDGHDRRGQERLREEVCVARLLVRLTPRTHPASLAHVSRPTSQPTSHPPRLSGRCRRSRARTCAPSSASSTRPTRCASVGRSPTPTCCTSASPSSSSWTTSTLGTCLGRGASHAQRHSSPPAPPATGTRAASGRSSRRGARRSSSAPTAASRRRRGAA